MNSKAKFIQKIWTSLHATLEQHAIKKGKGAQTFTQQQCAQAFNELPQELKEEAYSWGFDTLIREKALDFWASKGCSVVDSREDQPASDAGGV